MQQIKILSIITMIFLFSCNNQKYLGERQLYSDQCNFYLLKPQDVEFEELPFGYVVLYTEVPEALTRGCTNYKLFKGEFNCYVSKNIAEISKDKFSRIDSKIQSFAQKNKHLTHIEVGSEVAVFSFLENESFLKDTLKY